MNQAFLKKQTGMMFPLTWFVFRPGGPAWLYCKKQSTNIESRKGRHGKQA